MSSYSELIKNFEKIRSYMREFYVYGFKSREEYDRKSSRSYDDERRRIESWMGEYISFSRTPEGKNVFISIDSRVSRHNPFYKALKTKSFTDGDITLHFILFDILYSPDSLLSLDEILEQIDGYLSSFQSPLMFDATTVRKKLNEYIGQGLITSEKCGKKTLYRRTEETEFPDLTDALSFFSEVSPCGVIGSFILDKEDKKNEVFCFKHHYMTAALDSDVTAMLFSAMGKKAVITATNHSRRKRESKVIKLIPLRIFISVQSGRQYLMAYHPDSAMIRSFRIDYLSDVKLEEPSPLFDKLREELGEMQKKMWGISVKKSREEKTEHIEFTVKIKDGEEYIIRRLEREKRIGYVEKTDTYTYRFSADVYDASEMIPWIRTFICRISDIHISNQALENGFKEDLREMYRMYTITEDSL